MSSSGFRRVEASDHAMRTLQPIIELSDKMRPSSSSKSLIKLSIGDPTLDGNICAPQELMDEMVLAVRSASYNGYTPVAGYDEVRDAVANYWKKFVSSLRHETLQGNNVLLVSGGSHGIVLSITAICNPGDNLLVPSPGFPHYKTVCESYNIEPRPYLCDPDNNWEIDLKHLRSIVDSKTRGIMLTNPSNPCGSNFSRKHVEDIIRLCEELQLPIISDEIYAEVVFKGEVFTSVADIETSVPRVILGGSAKSLAVPGWRVGWVILVDRDGVATKWFDGMERLAQLLSGVNSVSQIAHIKALLNIPQSHIDSVVATLEEGASAYESLKETGFSYNVPRASMFVMVKIDFNKLRDIKDDVEFYEKLLDEENVQILPGSIFGLPGFFRATISRPVYVIHEAVNRIKDFCSRHIKN